MKEKNIPPLEQFDIVFSEHFDGLQYIWNISKLYGLSGRKLREDANEKGIELFMTEQKMNKFIKALGSNPKILIIESSKSWITRNHPEYDSPLLFSDIDCDF